MINNRMNRMRQTLYNPEKENMGQISQRPSRPDNNVKNLQKKLQKVSFALVEVILYLDAYPNCEKAKKYDLLLVPSDSFGFPGYVRLSYCVSTEMIERSLPSFRKLAEEYNLI